MAIKLYKSQLTPTSGTSNVTDTRQISLAEAQAPAKAMKGFLNSGENLYIKHQQIKSECGIDAVIMYACPALAARTVGGRLLFFGWKE